MHLAHDFDQLFADHCPGHDEIQVDHFILGKSHYGSAYGLYHQALREFVSRTRSLSEMYFQNELDQVDLDEMQYNLGKTEDSFERRRLDIQIRQLRGKFRAMSSTIKQHEFEWCRFYAWARAIKEHLGEITLDHKREFWVRKFIVDSGFKMKTGQAPPWATIYSLPRKMRNKVLEGIKNPAALEITLKSQNVALPSMSVDIPELTHTQVKEMVHAAVNSERSLIDSIPNDPHPGRVLEGGENGRDHPSLHLS